MRIKILSLLLLSFLASASVKNGEIAPSFSLLNQDNESVSLDEFKGKKKLFLNGLITTVHL
jgi:peroxiredoxin